eukprot:gene13671-9792_t
MSAFLRMLVAFVWCCSLPVQPFALHGLQTKSLVSRGAALPLAKLDYQAIPLKREGPLSALDPARRRYRILDGQRPLHTRALYWLEDARAFSEHRLRVILRSLTGAGESPVQADLFVDLWRALKRLFSPETPTVPIPEEAQPRNPRERPALALSRANFLPAAYFAAPANGSRPVSGSGSAPLLTLPFQLGRKPRLRSSNVTDAAGERRHDAVQYLLQRYNLSASPAAAAARVADNASATLSDSAEGRPTRWRSAASFAGRVASSAAAYVSTFNRQQYGREYALNVLREIHALRRGRQETAEVPAASSTTTATNETAAAANATHLAASPAPTAPTEATAANGSAPAATLVGSASSVAEADALVAYLQASRGQALRPLSREDNDTLRVFAAPEPSQWWRLTERRDNDSAPSTLLLRFGAAPTADVLVRPDEAPEAAAAADAAELARGTWRSLAVDRDVVGLEFSLRRDGPALRYRGAAVGGRVLGSVFADDDAGGEQSLGAFQLAMAGDL